MPHISATQTIAPAVARTKPYLFQPLRWPRLIKLTLIASLVVPGLAAFNSTLRHNTSRQHRPVTPHHSPAMHHPVLFLAIALAVLTLSLALSYLFIRLRFSYFDCVLRLQDRIRPAWARYHRQSLRYLALGLILGLPFVVILGLFFVFLFHHYGPLLSSIAQQRIAAANMVPVIATAIVLFVLLGILFFLVELAMQFLVLPRMALEDTSISASLNAAWSDIRQEPLQYLALAALNLVFFILASVVTAIVLAMPYALLHKLQPEGSAPGRAAAFAVTAIILALVSHCLSGVVGTFRLNWALLFYGARYPELGRVLATPTEFPPNPDQPFQQS